MSSIPDRDNEAVDLAALALLGVVLGVLVRRGTGHRRREHERFKRLRSTGARQVQYRRWVFENALELGGLSLAALVGGGVVVPEMLAAAQSWEPIAAMRDFLGGPWGAPVGVGIAVVLLAALVVPVIALRHTVEEAPALGDIRALLPRNRAELPYGAGLSIVAGLTEELLFRLGLPALAFAVTQNAWVAFLGAAAMFGLLHAYQGVVGVVASTITGLILLAVFLVTGSLVLPIVLHVLFDLRTLVLIPIAIGGALRKP